MHLKLKDLFHISLSVIFYSYAFCFSRIAHGIEVYGAATNTCIHKVQVIQNRILKTVYNKDWYAGTNILHKHDKGLNILLSG